MVIYRLMPLLVVFASVVYLFSGLVMLFSNEEVLFIKELLGTLMAILGLSIFWGRASSIVRGFFFGSTVVLRDDRTVQVSERNRKTLAKNIREGNVDYIRISRPLMSKINKGFSGFKGAISREKLKSEKLEQILFELSRVCHSLVLPEKSKVITDEQISTIVYGVMKRIYSTENLIIEIDLFGPPFNAYGFLNNINVPNKARMRIFDLPSKPEDVDESFLWGPRFKVDKFGEQYFLEEIIPALLENVIFLKRAIKVKGGVVETVDRYYWDLNKWGIEFIKNPVLCRS